MCALTIFDELLGLLDILIYPLVKEKGLVRILLSADASGFHGAGRSSLRYAAALVGSSSSNCMIVRRSSATETSFVMNTSANRISSGDTAQSAE